LEAREPAFLVLVFDRDNGPPRSLWHGAPEQPCWLPWEDLAVGAPTGTVTFLFTDIEGSTALWEADPDRMRSALATHDEVLRSAIAARGGYVFKCTGDGMCAAFASPQAALGAAVDAQERLGLPVRMGLATGDAELREGDYFGPALNRAARIMTAAHGGQVLVAAGTAALVGEEGLRPLGDHVLSGLRSPERLFQADAGVHPPIRASGAVRSNLPAELSGFVGRDEEVREVLAALGPARMVTLAGMGGVGKTRLGLRAAAELVALFPDGVWLVQLAPLGHPDRLVEVVAAGLGVPERPGQPLEASVIDHLRGRELLIVLDNCEHLDDAVAGWATNTLGACPNVRIMATSRRRLGVPGEHVLAVSPLKLPAVTATDAEIASAEAVQLFVDRAVAARATFALTEVNAPAVGRLVRLLDGIPLAIELAAARVRSQSPAELADLFQRTGTPGGYEPLRRAIDWSYGLLSDQERSALALVSVFAGSFELAAAEAVTGVGRGAVDLLDALVESSLVVAEDVDGSTRYRLLETIRHFGIEHLDAADGDACRQRHAVYYVEFAEHARAGVQSEQEAFWTSRVLAELDNLRAVLGWVTTTGDIDLGHRLVIALQSGLMTPAAVTHDWAIPVVAIPGAPTHPLHPAALAYAGWAHANLGEPEAARRRVAEALALAGTIGVSGGARCQMLFAAYMATSTAGDYERSEELGEQWLEAARSSDDDFDLLMALNVKAVSLASGRTDPFRAQALASQVLELAERRRNPSAMVVASIANGLAWLEEDPAAALVFFDRGLEAATSVTNHTGAGTCLAAQAWVRYEQGEIPVAASLLLRATDLFKSGAPAAFGAWLALAALVLEAAGDDEGSATLRGAPAVVAGRRVVVRARERLAATEQALRARMGDDAFEARRMDARTMSVDAALNLVGDRLVAYLRP
jgi:predicted ATPase/class 3 adenylate cyclase